MSLGYKYKMCIYFIIIAFYLHVVFLGYKYMWPDFLQVYHHGVSEGVSVLQFVMSLYVFSVFAHLVILFSLFFVIFRYEFTRKNFFAALITVLVAPFIQVGILGFAENANDTLVKLALWIPLIMFIIANYKEVKKRVLWIVNELKNKDAEVTKNNFYR